MKVGCNAKRFHDLYLHCRSAFVLLEREMQTNREQPILLIMSCRGVEIRKEDLIEFSYKEKTTCKMHAALIVYTTE